MNIIICVKQVPDSTEVKINPETNTLMREGVKSVINPFDYYAIEEAVKIKERFGGKVTVITMGPPQAGEVLKEAVTLGCDEAFLLCDRKFAGSDTWATSYALAAAIKHIGEFNLILCGKQASDGDTAQVGPGIAAHLNISQAVNVSKIDFENENKAVVNKMTEQGYDVCSINLPCVMTVVKEINTPRMPSLKGIMRAKKAQIKTLGADDIKADASKIGLEGSPTRVVKIFAPQHNKENVVFNDCSEEVINKIAKIIKDGSI